MKLQLFRYAACGGGGTALNILVYYLLYHFIIKKQFINLRFFSISPHIAAFIAAFCITFPISFYLSMYVVFQESYLKRRTQLSRYFFVCLCCLLLNYVFLKFFVESLGWYPTPSLIITAGIVIFFSYIAQRFFTFKREKLVGEQELQPVE